MLNRLTRAPILELKIHAVPSKGNANGADDARASIPLAAAIVGR